MKRLGQDPCTRGPAMNSLIVSYCKLCIDGTNIKNKDDIRADTVSGYMREVNELFKKRELPPPIDFRDRKHLVNVLIANLKAEEDVANQRSPFTPQMVAEFIKRGKAADHDSLEACALDVIISGREMGLRASEVTTTTSTKPDYFKYPRSERYVVKAMCADWWTSLDKDGNTIENDIELRNLVKKMIIYWKIQKNRRNNDPVTYVVDEDPDFCIVHAILSMKTRARNLGQPDHLPLAVYRDKNGKKVYLTSRALTNYIRDVAKAVHPTLSKKELMKFSCHSIRVWACVLLHEAGKKGDYIKKRLRWLSECYRVYLRDTEVLASQHNQCLREYADLINSIRLRNLPDNVEYSVDEDTEMGDYDDLDG